MVEDWQHFLLPYQQAVNELKVKLRGGSSATLTN